MNEKIQTDFNLWEKEIENTASVFYVGLVKPNGREPSKTAGYKRVRCEFVLMDESVTNADPITFPASEGEWGVVLAFGLWEAPTGGKRLYTGPLATPHIVVEGEHPYFGLGNLLVMDCDLLKRFADD